MRYCYISQETGEVYKNLLHAFRTIIKDMLHYPKCRTWRMFHVKKEVY